MPTYLESNKSHRPILSIIFFVLYLILAATFVALPFVYQNLPALASIGIQRNFVLVPALLVAAYFGLISLSFFLRGDNWLIFSIVLLFFSTLGALILAIIGGLNAKNLLHSGIPSCIHDLYNCTAGDGVLLFSALLLGISIPTLILNLLTSIAIFRTMGAND